MKICYDESKYVKGKRIYRIKDLECGKVYIVEDNQFDTIKTIKVYAIESYDSRAWGADYKIVDALGLGYRLNNHEYRMWDYMMQENKQSEFAPTLNVYEAETPHFTCKNCGSHELPNQVKAVHIRKYAQANLTQRIGYSCNYGRCVKCNTLQRHIVNTGYPTKWEARQEWVNHPTAKHILIPKPTKKDGRR